MWKKYILKWIVYLRNSNDYCMCGIVLGFWGNSGE